MSNNEFPLGKRLAAAIAKLDPTPAASALVAAWRDQMDKPRRVRDAIFPAPTVHPDPGIIDVEFEVNACPPEPQLRRAGDPGLTPDEAYMIRKHLGLE